MLDDCAFAQGRPAATESDMGPDIFFASRCQGLLQATKPANPHGGVVARARLARPAARRRALSVAALERTASGSPTQGALTPPRAISGRAHPGCRRLVD